MGVGEQRDRLVDQPLEELEGGLRLGVDGHTCDPDRAARLVGRVGSRRRQVRVGSQPRGGVTGHVQLRHDPDAQPGGVVDQVPHVVVGQELAVVGNGVQPWPDPALDAMRLVVAEVQVQDVEPCERHRVESPVDRRRGDPVPAHVEEQASPGERGCIWALGGAHARNRMPTGPEGINRAR